jgi:glycosyltransferase involved in cell wall biosynthesis
MAYGKPIITTGYSGNMDFTNDANSFLLPYQMTVVCNLPWIPYYQSTMRWAEPDLDKLVEYMQYTYRDIKNARANNIDCETFRRARQGQADVLQKFNWQTSAESFYRAVKEVANG